MLEKSWGKFKSGGWGAGRQCHAKNLYSGHDFCGPAPVSFSPFSSSGLLPFLGVFFSDSRLSLILPLPMCPCCSSSQDTNGYLESSSILITHFFFCKIFPLLCVYGCFAYMCVCTTCIQCLRSQKRETYPLGMQLKMVVSQPWELEIKLEPLQEPPVLLTTQLLHSFSLLFYSFLSPERRGLLVMSFRTKHSKDSHSLHTVKCGSLYLFPSAAGGKFSDNITDPFLNNQFLTSQG